MFMMIHVESCRCFQDHAEYARTFWQLYAILRTIRNLQEPHVFFMKWAFSTKKEKGISGMAAQVI